MKTSLNRRDFVSFLTLTVVLFAFGCSGGPSGSSESGNDNIHPVTSRHIKDVTCHITLSREAFLKHVADGFTGFRLMLWDGDLVVSNLLYTGDNLFSGWEENLAKIKQLADWCQEAGVTLTICLYEVPGRTSRNWSGVDDARFWSNNTLGEMYRKEYTRIWEKLAVEMAGYPGEMVKFDIAPNESQPSLENTALRDYNGVANVLQDQCIIAIRKKDDDRRIIASPDYGLNVDRLYTWCPTSVMLKDKHLSVGFHVYVDGLAIQSDAWFGRVDYFRYPGPVGFTNPVNWNFKKIQEEIGGPIADFQMRYPGMELICTETSCMKTVPGEIEEDTGLYGAARYLRDILQVLWVEMGIGWTYHTAGPGEERKFYHDRDLPYEESWFDLEPYTPEDRRKEIIDYFLHLQPLS